MASNLAVRTPSPLRNTAMLRRCRYIAPIVRSSAAVLLSLLLPSQFLPAQVALSAPQKPATSEIAASQPSSQPDQRILHLLSRFTFGPTLEEITAIHSLGSHGIDLWLDQQLHPDRIPTSP